MMYILVNYILMIKLNAQFIKTLKTQGLILILNKILCALYNQFEFVIINIFKVMLLKFCRNISLLNRIII